MADVTVGGVEREPTTNPVLLKAQQLQAASANKAKPATTPAPAAQAPGTTVTDSTKTTVKTTSIAPIDSPAATTFESAQEAIEFSIREQQEFTRRYMRASEKQEDALNASANLVREGIQDQQMIQTTESVADLKAQLGTEEVFEALGGAEYLAELAAGKKAAIEDMLQKQEAVRKNVDVDFTSDPGQWLINKFTIGALDEEANVAEMTVRKYNEAINNITGLASKVDQTLTDVAVTKTKATVAAESRLLEDQARLNAMALTRDAAAVNAERVNFLSKASRFERNSIVEQYKLGLLAKSEEAQVAERQARKEALNEDAAFKQTLVAGVLEGRKRMGVPTYMGSDPNTVDQQFNEIVTQYKLGGDLAKEIDNQYDVGIGVVAPTPYETYQAYIVSDENKLYDGTNRALVTLQESRDDLDAIAQQKGLKLKAEAIPELVNKIYNQKMEAYEKEIKFEDDSNPNKALPMAELLSHEAVKYEPLVQLVLSQLLTDEVKDISHEKVVQTAFAAVKTKDNPDGTITFRQAVDGINNIYTQAVVMNNVMQERQERGLIPQQDYNARLKIPGLFKSLLGLGEQGELTPIFKSKRVVDLSDFNDVSELGIKIMSKTQFLSSRPEFNKTRQEQLDNLLAPNRTQEK